MEIEEILIKFGAKGILKEYAGSKINALMFYIEREGQQIPFKIPMSIDKTRRVISNAVNEGKLPKRYLQEPLRSEQGERVAWRIIKDWLFSQLSLFEMQFAEPIELFLPYAYNPVENKTMYDKFLENKESYLALENKDEKY